MYFTDHLLQFPTVKEFS